MKFNRRGLLLAGLGAGVTAASAKENARIQAVQKHQDLQALARETLSDELSIIESAYASEADWDNEVEKRRKLLSAINLAPPIQPYNRERSKRMIHFCKLAVQQYKTGRANPNYDGAINLLPAYRSRLKDYSQLTNFTSTQEIIEDYFKPENSPIPPNPKDNSTPLDQTFQAVELTLQDRVRQILQHKYRLTVFSGMALTSKDHNILVFRGTQTQTEWLKNLNAAQKQYVAASGQVYGEVHEGFLQVTQELKPSVAEVAQQLDPTIPCYVTGHSLGAAIATLAAFELVQAVPQLKDQIQLYTFAGPRVCSPTFAAHYSQLIPNAYRIVNLADTVPLVPPVTLGDSYVHIGQEWSFLAQFGDTLLNHVVDTYQLALEQEAETDQVGAAMRRLQFK
ncbi:MAG: lipase family protein [Leptolyngbyaceae cyanobacterium MO_188.B28]|nr:lipase family protein [Leptolyngbyaceae cyanobacterium MO_188.B28]